MDTIESFRHKIYLAKLEGREWVETDQNITKIFNRGGIGKADKYWIFEGIFVCDHGKTDECIQEMNIPMSHKMHGAVAGNFDGR